MHMKNYISNTAYLLGTVFIVSACQVKIPYEKTPEPSYYGNVERTLVTSGFPEESSPWVAISDRSRNTVNLNKDKNQSPKEIKFLEPLIVVKYRKSQNLLKVAEYSPDALVKNGSAKNMKTYGWIPEDQLLLWNNSLRERNSGFVLKAVVTPNNMEVVNNAKAYLKNDSVLVFQSPNLLEPTKKKLPVGQLVYVYKQAENNKRYLIGKSPKINLDSIDSGLYGWVSSSMLSTWGERTAIKFNNNHKFEEGEASLGIVNDPFAANNPVVKISDAEDRSALENIFPTSTNKQNITTKYFTNAFDFSKNSVSNVLGEPLMFNRFKEIVKKNKNLNIVFALDISSENREYTPIAKSIIQDLQIKIDALNYYKNIKYGVSLYKNNSCGDNVSTSELTNDFNAVFNFIDEKIKTMNCEGAMGQPVSEGLTAAGNLLSNVPDETNIVVLVGSTSDSDAANYETIKSLTAARARVVSYQTQSRISDYYTNFVLLSENVVSTSAKNIAELNKERVVDQGLILNKNNFNLVEGDEGLYSLDYPNNSMWQGVVIYPKKREFNKNSLVKKALDSLLAKTIIENKTTDNSLTSYFKTKVGTDKTGVDPKYINLYPSATFPISSDFASEIVTYDNPSLISGYVPENLRGSVNGVEKGILISEAEYDRLRELYNTIYKETGSETSNFSQSSAIAKYIKIIKDYNFAAGDMSRSTLYSKPMSNAVAKSTGFDNSHKEIMSSFSLRDWKKNKMVDSSVVQAYFKNYKNLAAKLLEDKNNPKIKLIQNGEVFYWLNEDYMPSTVSY